MTLLDELVEQHQLLVLFEANEAETRLKLINRVLFEVLGWGHDDVSVEERVSEDGKTTYADYIVRTAGSAFVIEAKKVGVTFSDVPESRRHRLSGHLMLGATGETILQAREYCRKKSIPFAVVTNGAQWIAFPAVRTDQTSFNESSAIIFPSLLSALRDDYPEFIGLLSRDEVIAGSFERELLGRNEDQFGQRRLKSFYSNRGRALTRNPLYPLIEDAVVTAFTDSIVDSSPALLEKCYVRTPERIRFDRQINMHISRRQAVVGRPPLRPLQKRDTEDLRRTIEQTHNVARPVAILVLGTVGAGKTTFLHYTRLVSSAEYFEKNEAGAYPHWISVDFRSFTRNEAPSDFIYRAMRDYTTNDWFLRNYEQCIRPAYKNEIRSLREGPLKLIAGNEEKINERISDFLLERMNGSEYLDRILSYATTRAPIFLVIDNVDQLESSDLQASVFAEAMAIAHKNRLNLVLSLREATFVKNRNAPTFDAFDFVPIAIDAPAIPAVLSRRFFLVKQLLAGREGDFIAENGAHVQVGDLSMIADLLSSSVLGTNIGTVIDVLSTSDVRLALRMTREFLESGYSNPGRAISLYRQTGSYVLPRHEALRSVMLGNHPVYSEEFSIIGNPFDARLSKNTHQLLRLFLLTALVMMSSNGDFQHVEGEEIRNSLRKIGFGDDAVQTVLVDLCRLRFIFTGAHSEPTLGSTYYPSRLGGYVVRYLIADLTFLEAVMMDTFIADRSTWEQLRELSDHVDAEPNVVDRLRFRHQRIKCFYDYMHGQYTMLLDEARRRALQASWCEDPFETAQKQLERNMGKALRSATRIYAS